MKSSTLTVRNLTIATVELKRIGRNDAQNVTYISKLCTSIFADRKRTSSSHIEIKSGSFSKKREELSITIGPFKSRTTNVQISTNEVIRFTFVVDGQLYQVDNAPGRSPYSTTLQCLSPAPRFNFTAIFHPQFAHLTLYSTSILEKWMCNLEDDIPLSALSIPGTHNSPTCYKALPSVRCQAVGIKKQLEKGVRFLDIRVQPENPEDLSKEHLILVHSAFPISLTGNKYLRDVIKIIDNFLDANPSETVILSVKREGVGKSTDQQLSKILYDHYAQDRNHWFTENRIPTLGEVRKKIVLIRRFCLDDSLKGENGGSGWALDAECWPDNCTDGSCAGGNIRIQDYYEVSSPSCIEKKVSYSIDQLTRSAQSMFDLNSVVTEIPKQPFFVNFLTASSFWSASCWPDRVAARVNPQIVEHLCLNHHNKEKSDGIPNSESKGYIGKGSTGIVVCDWIGRNDNWDLVNCIVGMNAWLQML